MWMDFLKKIVGLYVLVGLFSFGNAFGILAETEQENLTQPCPCKKKNKKGFGDKETKYRMLDPAYEQYLWL